MTASIHGLILAGGQSTRMGTDKAFLELEAVGKPLVAVSRDALLGAGATSVRCVGGDGDRLRALDLEVLDDEHPGEGPLGGLLTGLRAATGAVRVRRGGGDAPAEDKIVVVLTCDLPAIDAATVTALVEALAADETADAAVPMLDGRRQILTAAYRVRVLGRLDEQFLAGERSVRRAVASLRVVELEDIDREALVDVDHPEDLDQWKD
jgi:molybdopterin-guanine dinucleotide biosynthesis protein A